MTSPVISDHPDASWWLMERAAPTTTPVRRSTARPPGRLLVGLAVVVVLLAGCEPKKVATYIGPGCRYPPSQGTLHMNQNTADGGDGDVNAVAYAGAHVWNTAGTDAPLISSYFPYPAAGKGDFEVHQYTSSTSKNSGYTSTVGPPSFPAPSCGASTWASRPHIWLNRDRIADNLAKGHPEWNTSTAAHELGHVLGLAHVEGSGCGFMPLMDKDATDTNGCGIWKPTSVERNGVNKIYN